MTNFNRPRLICAILLFSCLFFAIPSSAQTFKNLVNFSQTNGLSPHSALVQGFDGNLYGTTAAGGNTADLGDGTIFRIRSSGGLSTIYSFCQETGCPYGRDPYAGLALGPDGNLYGTNQFGGNLSCPDYPDGCGTVFKTSETGAVTLLRQFDFSDGQIPNAPLALGRDGSFYGSTPVGGPTNGNITCDGSCGTLFKITSDGTFTSLYDFCVQNTNCPDGFSPNPPVLASDGNFYGTTLFGGNLDCNAPNGCGTVYKLSPSGSVSTLYTFGPTGSITNGYAPSGPLTQGSDGNLYGTTILGGTSTNCAGGCGTVFKLSLTGQLTTLHSFQESDGATLYGGVIQATDGNFYGTTYRGGTGNYGTIFGITPSGTFTSLHSFDSTDGTAPIVGLFQATNGTLYGTTEVGGDLSCNEPNGCGTVFSISVGLGPFVSFVQRSGRVGAETIILGQGLASTGAVSFNGVPATIVTKSNNTLSVTIPEGATSGFVTVTTPTVTLTSNTKFIVLP
jgi:uncharacterized repeat protein (TIGR03803 family)